MRLICNKIGPTGPLNLKYKNSRQNAFRSKQKTSKVPRNIVRHFEVKTKARLMFQRPKHNMKGKCYVFSSYKRRNNVCLVHLEWKLQQHRYG